MSDDVKIDKINELGELLGIDKRDEKTIFEIDSNGSKETKTLSLKSGSWQSKEPWFGIDESGDVHIMVSLKSLTTFMDSCKGLAKENFDLKLEKSIMQQFPLDFNDVWVVCMDEIRKIATENKNKRVLDINLEGVVEKIKKEHPNLFVNLDQFVGERR